VAIRPAPETAVYEGWRFESFSAGVAVLRRLAQDGPTPTVLRLSDETETALNLAQPMELDDGGAGALAIVGYEGAGEYVEATRARVAGVLGDAGGQQDLAAGEAWARDRYRGPYLRDALLDAGALVETLETAAFWSGVDALYRAVGEALRTELTGQGTPPVVLCHISHVYPSGASLYFTVGCAQLDDSVAQWTEAKRAATDAIMATGGTVTHHHGVGSDHQPWLAEEIGPLGIRVLRAVKAELDPAGILNPGVLIPRG
jgi:alkyldihydroxyacetonephosphate synthase